MDGSEGHLTTEDLGRPLRAVEAAHAGLRPSLDDRLRQKIHELRAELRFWGRG